ncbi:hypothetical protein Q3G72_025452 [Acer saccharum]|nr:hypothetical protein Q3G72_025452 [Acer saccharum]
MGTTSSSFRFLLLSVNRPVVLTSTHVWKLGSTNGSWFVSFILEIKKEEKNEDEEQIQETNHFPLQCREQMFYVYCGLELGGFSSYASSIFPC